LLHPIIGNPLVRAGLALAVVMLLGTLLIRGGPETSSTNAAPHASVAGVGDTPRTAPAYSLRDRDGVEHTLADLAGRPVLLNFWASWCPPCLDEMPSLQALADGLSETDLVVVAVTLDESWADATGAMGKTGFGEGVLVLADPERAVANAFGTLKVPETYLIDRQGQIVHQFIGPRDWRDPDLITDMQSFASGSPTKGETD